jgi:hypothetical protein
MLVPAIFGIKNSGVNLAIDLIILFLVVIWLALVYWTFADARRRISDPLLVGCATVASLFPFVGTLVYMIVRPPEYLDDVRERELEIQAAEARLAELGYRLCPHCDHEVEKDFLRCPHCLRKLKDPCPVCGKPLDPMWKVCPFCEADVAAPPPPSRRTRRRREGAREARSEMPAGATSGRERDGVGASARERDAIGAPPRERDSVRPPAGDRESVGAPARDRDSGAAPARGPESVGPPARERDTRGTSEQDTGSEVPVAGSARFVDPRDLPPPRSRPSRSGSSRSGGRSQG